MRYTQEQLKTAFNLVRLPSQWKDKVRSTRTTCKESEVSVVMEAIIRFTGKAPKYSNKRIVKRAHGRFIKGDVIYDITAVGKWKTHNEIIQTS